MATGFLRRCVALAVAVLCAFTMNVGISESEPIYCEDTMIAYLVNKDQTSFTPILADWGMQSDEVIDLLPNKEDFLKECETNEYLIQEMQNGHISMDTNMESVFADSERAYTTTFVFSEEGLYTCNMRTMFSKEDDTELRKNISEISAMIGETVGMTDANGLQLITDYSECDLDNFKASYIWVAEDGTFIALQMASLKNIFFVDVNTGLISYFTMLLND